MSFLLKIYIFPSNYDLILINYKLLSEIKKVDKLYIFTRPYDTMCMMQLFYTDRISQEIP